jgi:DNA-binding transcriptional MerR regulator
MRPARWVGFGETIPCVEFGGKSLSTGPDSSDQGSRPVYSIGAVARMLDIPASTIRAWEERYEVVRPDRSEGAQRVYSRNQVEQLRFIKAKMEVGVSAADAHRLLSQELEASRLPVAVRQSPTAVPPLILLAERDPYAADLAEYFLRTEGYDVCVALDATQATLLFQERSPDVVIIDLLISGGAGFRLCREFAAAAGAQVLAVASIESTGEALSSGAAAFLHKPLQPLKLVSTVRDLLGTSALVRSQGYARDLR